ncbi:hypothetical protein ACJW30_12G014400 [Castanea mollissima]
MPSLHNQTHSPWYSPAVTLIHMFLQNKASLGISISKTDSCAPSNITLLRLYHKVHGVRIRQSIEHHIFLLMKIKIFHQLSQPLLQRARANELSAIQANVHKQVRRNGCYLLEI